MRPFYITLVFVTSLYFKASTQTCGAIAYNSDDGLAATNYMGVFQDSRGILWVGSYSSGVSRFNGNRWENWATANKLLSNTVNQIFEDKEGGIWLNHNDKGFSRFKNSKWQKFDFFQDTCVKGTLLFDNRQKKVLLIEGIGAANSKPSTQLLEYDYSAKKFINTGKHVLPDNIAANYDNFQIWQGEAADEWWVIAYQYKNQSTDYYHIKKGQPIKLPMASYVYRDHFEFLYTNTALSPKVGEAVGRSDKGVFVLNNNHWKPLTAPNIPRYTDIGNTPPLLFVGCSYDHSSHSLFVIWRLDEKAHEKRYLLAEYDEASLKLRQTMLFSNPVGDINSHRQIIKDAAGTIWVATSGNVLRLFPDQLYIPVTTPGMPSQAWGVAQAGDGNIWFSSSGDGLAGFDGLYLKPQPVGLRNNKVYNDCSLTDENGNVYFNSSDNQHGILKFDGKSHWDILLGGYRVIGFFLNRDKKGQILWGTSGQGLWILPKGKTGKDALDWIKINQSKGLRLENVLTALEDRFGHYWMGRSSQGIAMYDPTTDKVLNWLRSQNPNNYGCMSSAEDMRGNLWFGTDRGLCFFETQLDIGPDFDLQNNLLPVGVNVTGESTVMSCMVYDAHTLVIGNKTGLHLLDLDAFYSTPRRILFRSFHLQNGYQAGPVGQNSLMVDRDSCIWLTAANGALRYDPRILPRDTARPQVFVDSLLANGTTFNNFTYCIPLGSDQRFLQFYFHAPPNPMLYDNLRFEYRLTGDSTWVTILPDAVSVTFPSLKAGRYRFEIRAVKEGLESASTVVEFKISPVLWETPLFWLVILGSVIGIGTLWWRREIKISDQKLQISNQQLQLEKSINEMASMSKEKDKLQVQAIVNQLNPHFINNALQWLQVRVDEDEEAVRVVGKLSENISTVFKNSRLKRAYHSLREEMKLTENYLFIQKCRFKDKLTYEMPDEQTLVKLENMSVPLMIVQIHAENAVEHGIRNKSTGVGRVNISLQETDHYAVITIEDDGIGREAAQIIGSKGTQNGTKMLRELETIYNKQNQLPLEQIYQDGIFVDKAGKGYGTRVIVRMPKNYNFEF